MEDGRKDCCKIESNLELKPDHPDARQDLEVRICKVCKRRHFTAYAKVGALTQEGKEI